MSLWTAAGPYERLATVAAGVVHLRGPDGAELVLEGVDADASLAAIPARVGGIRLEPDVATGGVFALLQVDPPLRLQARSWCVHEPQPQLYAAPLARFAPTPKEERTIRWLLRLLRVPGITRLIRVWHAWRTR